MQTRSRWLSYLLTPALWRKRAEKKGVCKGCTPLTHTFFFGFLRLRPEHLPYYLLLGCLAALLTACGSSSINPDDYYHTSPAEYYLYVPAQYTPETNWPVFIGVHGAGRTGLDCWNDWQPYADEEGFILICPSMGGDSRGWYRDEGEEKLNAILGAVNGEYSIKNRYFLAGFSAGAFFVESYSFRYAKWVAAVSMISAGDFEEATSQAKNIPYLVIVGGNEEDRLELNRGFTDNLKQLGFTVTFHVVPNAGHTMTEEAKNLTIEFYRQHTP